MLMRDYLSDGTFSPIIVGRELTLVFEAGWIQDQETSSTWNLAEQAIEGEMAGDQLKFLPVRSTHWFALVANFPDIEVYEFGY